MLEYLQSLTTHIQTLLLATAAAPKPLRETLPYVRDVVTGLTVLLIAYILATPLRRRYTPSDGVDAKRHAGWQFVGVLANYVVVPILVLAISTPLVYAINHGQPIWSQFHRPWLLFWGLYGAVRLAEGLFVEGFAQMGRRCPLSRLTRGMLRLAIIVSIVFLLLKYQMGRQIGVLLTSTAIVTGVIGFAMQGVLGNLLAGMSLHACRTMTVGDWIEVDGTIGQVILVNWRETRLRTRSGHIVIVPNGKLADTTIRNFSSPTPLRRHQVIVSGSYGDAPGDVIAALEEAAREAPLVEKDPPPSARVVGFKDFCVEYVLRFWSTQYQRRTTIEGGVQRLIWYKFQRRGIEIPFPMSGRMMDNFMEAVHAARLESPSASEIERVVTDLVRSDFGRKLMADAQGVCMLSRDEMKTVARDVRRILFTHGETLMHQKDEGESFYVLVKGAVRGTITNSDMAKPIEFELHPGALFGEMSLLTGLPRTATMTAITDCELLEFNRAAFSRLLSLREEIPQVLSDLAATRAAQNAASLEKLRATSTTPVELAKDGILRRLKRILGEWRGR